METYHSAFLRHFQLFAQMELSNSAYYNGMKLYAFSLNDKAVQIMHLSAFHPGIDPEKLQKAIFESGKCFVQQFAVKNLHRKRK